jgi:hypothetical protein
MNPLSPAIVQVDDSTTKKTMLWPLTYALSGQDADSLVPMLDQFQQQINVDTTNVDLWVVPERVVAVARFSDATCCTKGRPTVARLVSTRWVERQAGDHYYK